MNNQGIRYQLFLLTSKVAVSTLILLSLVYSLYITLFAHGHDEYNWIPSTHDWILTLLSGLLSASVALLFAWSFARRVAGPLNGVALAARKIAEGNLKIRAAHYPDEIKETTLLIDDFNTMAQQLEVMSDEMKKWNAVIAHELRTPVTVLQGRLQGMADGIFDKSEKQFTILMRQTDALSRLIDDLRVLSLFESGQLHLYRETVDLRDMILSTVELFRDKMSAAGQVPVVDADETLCFIDDVRIRQVFAALLSNACKYAVPGEVRITCHVKGDAIVVTVEDEGPGIDAVKREAIFGAFVRGENDRLAKPEGSGLGLAVVHAISRAHGGEVACLESQRGGTAIRISLPAG